MSIRNREQDFIGKKARIIEVKTLTPIENLYTLRFLSKDEYLDFKPGQFVMFSIPGIGEFPVSVCSSPTRRPHFQLCIRKVGRVTSYVHESLEEGSEVFIRGPFGNWFPLELMEKYPAILVAGGLGMAPLRSVLQYHVDNQSFAGLYLFYGVKNYEYMLFKEEILWLLEHGHKIGIHVFLSFEKEDETFRSLSREYPENVISGMVTDVIRYAKDKAPFSEAYYMICGPPVMYKFVLKEILDLGASPGRIYMTLERRMKCGMGKCGHCIVGTSTSIKYVCIDGPVFTYWDALSTRGLI